MEFVEHELVWSRLRKQGVVELDGTAPDLHLDLDDSTEAVALDVAAAEHPGRRSLPRGIMVIPRSQFGAVVEGILHKLRIAETVVMPIGRWRGVFEAVAEPMSRHEAWRDIDSAATVELNTRDPLLVLPADHHLLRDLLDSLVARGTSASQGVSVVALGVRLLVEVVPPGQMIVFAGDAALLQSARGVLEHHAAPTR